MTKDEAIERLREWFPRGATVYTVLRHRARSGMQRTIGVVAIGNRGVDGYLPIRHPNVATAEALGLREDRKHDGVIIGGCGMDKGHEIAYRIATVCYGDGYALRHEWI